MLTFKRMYGEYIVTYNRRCYAFATCRDAVAFIFEIRKGV
jgi:hypothetical protein